METVRETATSQAAQELTIVRLKRKRNEEPLDGLVVQQLLTNGNAHSGKKLKKQNGSPIEAHEAEAVPAIFRFAETVDTASFTDSAKTKQLKERIVGLINRRMPGYRQYKDRSSERQLREEQVARFRDEARKERYKVISRNRQKGLVASMNKVGEKKDGAVDELFNLYDVVKDDSARVPTSAEGEASENEPDIMDNFIPLVQEYLLLQDRHNSKEIEPMDSDEKGEDYVYDIFYHDNGMHLDINQNYRNLAALSWFDDDDSVFLNDSPNDSDYDDEDEDSNAEDYYAHDYPEEDSTWTDQEEYGSRDSSCEEYDSDDLDDDHAGNFAY